MGLGHFQRQRVQRKMVACRRCQLKAAVEPIGTNKNSEKHIADSFFYRKVKPRGGANAEDPDEVFRTFIVCSCDQRQGHHPLPQTFASEKFEESFFVTEFGAGGKRLRV